MPKSGCTSIKNWFYFLDHGTYLIDPLQIHQLDKTIFPHYDGDRERLVSRFSDSFVFTFVRHPLERAYSAYREKIIRIGPQSFKKARDFIELHYRVHLSEDATLIDNRLGFLVFLQFVRDTRDGRVPFSYDWHWATQTHVVKNALAVRTLDFIGRLESAEDRQFVVLKAGQPFEQIPKSNEGPRYSQAYSDVLTPEIEAAGREIYGEDLLNFAYTI